MIYTMMHFLHEDGREYVVILDGIPEDYEQWQFDEWCEEGFKLEGVSSVESTMPLPVEYQMHKR